MLSLIVMILAILVFCLLLFKKSQIRIIPKKFQRILDRFVLDYTKTHDRMVFKQKKKLFAPLKRLPRTGSNLRILQIGDCSKSNLELFPGDTILTVIDPYPDIASLMELYMNADGRYLHLFVKLDKCIVSEAENMTGVPDHSVDVVICTFGLCCVKDVQAVCKEVQRVLVPGGKFFFMEHVVDDKPSFIKLVQVVASSTRIWKFLFDADCRSDRDIENEIGKAGFETHFVRRFRLHRGEQIPFLHSVLFRFIEPHLYGVATVAAKT